MKLLPNWFNSSGIDAATNPSDRTHHWSGAYVLDALDSTELALFESHFRFCEVCESEVHSYREVVPFLAMLVETSPPTVLRYAVVGAVAKTRQDAPFCRLPEPALAGHVNRNS